MGLTLFSGIFCMDNTFYYDKILKTSIEDDAIKNNDTSIAY